MTGLQDLKSRYMAYLGSMDFDKMDLAALTSYGYILKNLDDMEKPNYAEALAMACSSDLTKKEAKSDG